MPIDPVDEEDQVLAGNKVDNISEFATCRSGYLWTEPGHPAADVIVYAREE